MDTVILRKLPFNLSVGPDAWNRPSKPQPVLLSLEIAPVESFEAAATHDDVSKSLDYGKLYKAISKQLNDGAFTDAAHLALHVWQCIPECQQAKIEIVLPKAVLRADRGLKYTVELRRTSPLDSLHPPTFETNQIMSINDLRCACIVGVNPHERLEKQIVVVDLDFQFHADIFQPLETSPDTDSGLITQSLPITKYRNIAVTIAERAEGSAYETIEALATAIAQTITMDHGIEAVSVQVGKPNAIANIEAAGVRIHRRASFFKNKNFWKVKRP